MEVEKVVEHDDGSATFHFDMSGAEKDIVVEIGLRTILISASIGINVDDMLQKVMEEQQCK